MRFQDLFAYQKSFDLAMKIFNISKSFPREETYSLTDQVRLSSRSVTLNIAEAYRKDSILKISEVNPLTVMRKILKRKHGFNLPLNVPTSYIQISIY